MVVLSETWREEVGKRVSLPKNKLFVVNNPITQDFEQTALQMPIKRSEAVILSLGTLGKDKGVFDLLEGVSIAAGRVAFKLVLAGPDREPGIRERVQTFITERGLEDFVTVEGSVWGEQKLELFRQASIFVLPSYIENFPLVILEAAAAGHAIISTPVGATPEFFKDGVSALFVEPKSPEQIARAIVTLIANESERASLGRAARETFCARLSRMAILESLKNVYESVLLQPVREEDTEQSTRVLGAAK
jgi:glycosyltransferase involved in cell wall biosynthesis